MYAGVLNLTNLLMCCTTTAVRLYRNARSACFKNHYFGADLACTPDCVNQRSVCKLPAASPLVLDRALGSLFV